MSQNNVDPYQPPTLTTSAIPTSAEIDTMRNIAFWQRFFSVLGYIISGLMVLVFAVQTILAASTLGAAPAVIGGLVMITVLLAMTIVIYIIPAVLLGNAAQATRAFGEGRITLADYATQQRKFWRYIGIMVSIIMALYLVLLVGFVFIGVAFTASQPGMP